MAIGERLADPWGLLAGGVSGGLAGATALALAGFPVAVPVALGVGAAVWLVKVGLDTMTDRRPALPPAPGLLAPPRGSPADLVLNRAVRAIGVLHDQTDSAPPVVRAAVAHIDDEAAGRLADLRRLASQVTTYDAEAGRIDVRRLHADARRLSGAVAAATDAGLRREHERAAHDVGRQLAVHNRMRVARDTLLATMESTAIALEGLIAQLAEILATAAASGNADTAEASIAALADDLEGMRRGLAESELASRQVLQPGTPT